MKSNAVEPSSRREPNKTNNTDKHGQPHSPPHLSIHTLSLDQLENHLLACNAIGWIISFNENKNLWNCNRPWCVYVWCGWERWEQKMRTKEKKWEEKDTDKIRF